MDLLKKIGKILLYVLAGTLALLFIAGIFLDPIAKRILENQVSNAAEGQYNLSVDDLDISIIAGNVSLSNIRFTTDTAKADSPPIVFMTANKVAISGVSWLTYLLENRLQTDKIILDSLNVELLARTVNQNTPDTSTNQGPFRLEQLDIYPALKEQVDRVKLDDLGLNDIQLTLINVTTQDTLAFNARELNFRSEDVLLDANKLFTDRRAFYATRINFLGQDMHVERTGNITLEGEAEKLQFITKEDRMSVLAKNLLFLHDTLERTDTMMFVKLEDFELRQLELNNIQEQNTAPLEKISLTGLYVINNVPAPPAPDSAQNNNPIKLGELSLGENLPEFVNRIELGELDINKVFVRQGDSIRVEDANFHAREIVVDEQSAFAENRFFHAQSAESNIELITSTTTMAGESALNVALRGFRMDMENGVGSIGFQELEVKPMEEPEGEMWFKAEIGPFRIVRLDTRNLQEGVLTVDSIGIQDPVLLVNLPENQDQKTQASAQSSAGKQQFSTPDLYPAIEGMLNQVRLGKFAVIGADIGITGLSGKEGMENTMRIPALYLQLRDILIAEGTAFEEGRVLHADDIAFRVENIEYPIDEVYKVKLDLARFSTYERFFELRGFKYGYEGKPEQIFEEQQTNEVMSMENKFFRINHLDFQRLIKDQAFIAGSARATGFEFYTYMNENFPDANTQAEEEAKKEAKKVGATMPQTRLKELETPVYLGSFDLNSGNIVYEQMVAGADTAGHLEITDVYVNARNITNLEPVLEERPEIKFVTGGLIMGTGPFEVAMSFDMNSEKNKVELMGTLDTLDVTELNQFTQYTSRLAFESGELYTVKWDIDATEEKATGTVSMSYDNLDIQISSSDSPDTTGLLKEVGSFLANNLVLESDVAAKTSEEPETEEITAERDEGENFPAYIIKSMVWGFVEIMVTIF